MPSTYTTNTGIEKPADGEQSGSWGDTVNDNMDILDRALNGVLSLSLVGTTTTLTTGSGSTSGSNTYGQYRVLVLGGSPTGTNTITVEPNDAQKLYFVKNSSGESAIFTQGSGGNVTVADGASAVIYCDGAGSGAAVVDVTASFIPVLANAGVTASVSEINVLDGVTATTSELNLLDGVTWTLVDYNDLTSTASELNLLDGVTWTLSDYNTLTATAAELNLLDGVTWTLSDYNTLTATAADLNVLDGITATTAELNYVDGVTSAIQTQIDAKAPLASPTFTGQVDAGDSIKLGLWEIYDTGTTLLFRYNGTDVFKVDSTGSVTGVGDVTAYGSI